MQCISRSQKTKAAANMNRLKKHFQYVVCYDTIFKDHYTSVMQVPKLGKVVLNTGLGRSTVLDRKRIIPALFVIEQVTGQKANVTRAKKSVDKFKLREKMPIGCMVTLRNINMCKFFDRLVNIVLPANMDGLSDSTFFRRFKATEAARAPIKSAVAQVGVQASSSFSPCVRGASSAVLGDAQLGTPYVRSNFKARNRGRLNTVLTAGFGIKDLLVAFRVSREIGSGSTLGADVVFCVVQSNRNGHVSAPLYFLSAFQMPIASSN